MPGTLLVGDRSKITRKIIATRRVHWLERGGKIPLLKERRKDKPVGEIEGKPMASD